MKNPRTQLLVAQLVVIMLFIAGPWNVMALMRLDADIFPLVSLLGFVGLFAPFALRWFLKSVVTVLGVPHRAPPLARAFLGVMFPFVFLPWMIHETGQAVSDVTGDETVKRRIGFLALALAILSAPLPIVTVFLTMMLPDAYGIFAFSVSKVIDVIVIGIALQTLISAALFHVENFRLRTAPDLGAAGGESPVAVRSR